VEAPAGLPDLQRALEQGDDADDPLCDIVPDDSSATALEALGDRCLAGAAEV
jgi:hypothetical protein